MAQFGRVENRALSGGKNNWSFRTSRAQPFWAGREQTFEKDNDLKEYKFKRLKQRAKVFNLRPEKYSH